MGTLKEDKDPAANVPVCEGDWCTQEVPIGVKIGWYERLLRGRDAVCAWYVESRLRVWHWARVGAVALMFIGAVGYAGHKAYRWLVKPVSLPTSLPDLPKKPASSTTPKAKPGAAGSSTPKTTRGSSGPAPSTPRSTRQYDNTRSW